QAPLGPGLSRYMVFNAGRFAALRGAGAAPGTGEDVLLPTATGVGHHQRDLLVCCLALASPGKPVENPRQVPAYRYSARYGPLPPCFARAMEVVLPSGVRRTGRTPSLLIGGTASVVGEDSLHAGDLGLQFEETCANLRSLIAAWRGPLGDRWAEHCREIRIFAP